MDIPITLKLEEFENIVWKFSNVNCPLEFVNA
jgi:hypothetical protein